MLVLLLTFTASAKEVTLPVDIGVGPAILGISGPVRQERLWHTGLSLTFEAIVDLVPETVFLSPKGPSETGVWGASWKLIGISVPLVTEPFRLAPEIGIPFMWMHVTSDALPSPTNVVRPGLEGRLDLEVPITPGLLFSGGWSSQVFPPQPLGGGVFESGPTSESVWHVGQAYAQIHVRVPVTLDI